MTAVLSGFRYYNNEGKNQMFTRRTRIIIWFAVIMTALGVISKKANAAELWTGFNWDHVSQLDVGPPWNDDPESSVDHLGVHVEAHMFITDNARWIVGVSLGNNTNLTGASYEWEDGDGIGTRLYLTYNRRLLKW